MKKKEQEHTTKMLEQNLQQAIILKNAGIYDAALWNIKKIFNSRPDLLTSSEVWASIFNSPSFFSRKTEDQKYFNYAHELMKALTNCLKLLDVKEAISVATGFVEGAIFRHTTHNQESLKSLMAMRAEVFDFALKNEVITRDFDLFCEPSKRQKIRFGIILKHLHFDPEIMSMAPFFDGLKGDQFEVFLILLSQSGSPQCSSYFKGAIDREILLPTDLESAVTAVRTLDLDILLFGNDISAKSSLMAKMSFFRLARKSAICVSTIATVASPYVDYYLGCQGHLDRGFDSEFHEQFCVVNAPGYAFWCPEIVNIENTFSREKLGLSDSTVLFVSGANQTKLHTDLLHVWSEILHRVPNSSLLLYPFPPHYGPERQQRVSSIFRDFNAVGISSDRIIILNALPGRELVLDLLKKMDVGLDSFPYPGVTTMAEAVLAGLPTVTRQGPVLRSDQGAAILKSIGVEELITGSIEDYVNTAVHLATDKKMRSELRAKLQSAYLPFFDSAGFSQSAFAAYREIYRDIGMTLLSRNDDD